MTRGQWYRAFLLGAAVGILFTVAWVVLLSTGTLLPGGER